MAPDHTKMVITQDVIVL